MKNKSHSMVTVVLAAGASKRMGEPKQLLNWGESTLLEHTINTVLQLDSDEVIVVLGANFELVKTKISDYPITILNNLFWEVGLGKSIACAVEYVNKNSPEVDAVMIVLADQPFIDSSHLKQLSRKFILNNKQIIATSYKEGKNGVPVIFDKNYFKELMILETDDGAKHLLKRYSESIEVLKPLSENLDIDSKSDYNYLIKEYFKK